MTPTSTAGRGWARTGIILGGLVSIAANIAHSFIPPHGAPTGWTPQVGAVVGAVVWPVFLFIAIEILARVAWPTGWWYTILRYGGIIPVAAVAALVSYRHLSGLLAYYGEEPLVYHLGPLAVDGLMVMATTALLAINTHTRTATTPAAPAHTTATAPPVAPATPAPAVPVAAVAAPDPAAAALPVASPAPAPTVTPEVVPVASRPEQATPTPAVPARVVPAAPAPRPAPSTPDTPVTRVHAATPGLPVPAAMLTRARHLHEAHTATTTEPMTPGELAVRMRVDTDTAAQLLAVLQLDNRPAVVTAANGHPVGARR